MTLLPCTLNAARHCALEAALLAQRGDVVVPKRQRRAVDVIHVGGPMDERYSGKGFVQDQVGSAGVDDCGPKP